MNEADNIEWAQLRGRDVTTAVNRATAGDTADAGLLTLLEADLDHYDYVLGDRARFIEFLKRMLVCQDLAFEFEAYVSWAARSEIDRRKGSKGWKMTHVREMWLTRFNAICRRWESHPAREAM